MKLPNEKTFVAEWFHCIDHIVTTEHLDQKKMLSKYLGNDFALGQTTSEMLTDFKNLKLKSI